MLTLPIDDTLSSLIDTLHRHSALVITAAPGAGKTTRVPPALIRAAILPPDAPNLIMLQPRRVAARAAAERIAAENRWQIGEAVGYHIRFEKRYTPHTRIRILTEAILTRMLLEDPTLDGIGAVLLDEFHERNIHTDLALAFLREVQQTLRPDLKIIVMSATLDAAPVAAFLGDAPVITVPGRTFPIEIAYRPLRDVPLETHLARIVDDALLADGDVLVFLPGMGEIERARRALASFERENIAVLPLHGSLDSAQQQRALAPDPERRRKIILATNIAETSLTIDGVRTVIDSGLARVASFDPDRGMDRLDLEPISKASATQRAGRAGRQAPGRAFRLWSQQEDAHLPQFALPEVERIDLAPTLLAVHAWGGSPQTFAWFERPPQERLNAAEKLLDLLGALHAGKLTQRGHRMRKVPAHPRMARLLSAAAGTALEADAVTLAALLSDDSRTGRGDVLSLLHRPPPPLEKVRSQFAGIARNLPREPAPHPAALADLLLLAYPDRVAKRRAAADQSADPHAAVMVGNRGLRLAPEALTPALAQSELFLAIDVQHDARNRRAEGLVRAAVPLAIAALARLFPDALREENSLEYDATREKVTAVRRRLFHDLMLEEDPHGHVDAARAGEILAAALAPRARELFLQNEAITNLLARLALVRHYAPEHAWPTFDDARLQELLATACMQKRTLAEVAAPGHLLQIIKSTLIYPLDRHLEDLAPETLQVPSGTHIRLAYTLPTDSATAPPAPILAVRLQELFGLTATPRLCNGRVPVLLHLLSPGYKPMQITSDLASFWKSAYFEVRKDLRARYPKHQWPDDPLTAPPEAKGRRKR